MHKEDCIFCKIAAKSIPAKVVYEDDEVLAFDDISPQAPVHVIVIPKSHLDGIPELGEDDTRAAGSLVRAARKIAKQKGIEGSGYRLVMNCNKDGGQAVFHIHLHLLGGRAMNWPPG